MPEQPPQPTSEHPHPRALGCTLLLPLGHEWLTYMWANLHVFKSIRRILTVDVGSEKLPRRKTNPRFIK